MFYWILPLDKNMTVHETGSKIITDVSAWTDEWLPTPTRKSARELKVQFVT